MVSLRYKLVGTGWSECAIRLGDQSATVTASYLSDALGDLANAVLALVRGSKSERVEFAEEPGEYRWVMEQADPGWLSVSILDFPEPWSGAPDRDGKAVLQGACATVAFATAMLEALDEVRAEHGETGYEEKWVDHSFPTKTCEAIREALATAR